MEKEIELLTLTLKTKNRRAKLIEFQDKKGVRLVVRSLTKDTGYGISAWTEIEPKRGKIKTTEVGFSIEGVKEVHAILGEYLKTLK